MKNRERCVLNYVLIAVLTMIWGCAPSHSVRSAKLLAADSSPRQYVVVDSSTYLADYNAAKKYDADFIYSKISSNKGYTAPIFELLYTEYGLDWLSRKMQKETRPFSTSYLTDDTRQHAVLELEISNGVITAPAQTVTPLKRPGLMPYTPPGAGNYHVIYRDGSKKELGRRTINNPAMYRVCDTKNSDQIGLMPIQSGTIELLIPADAKIKYVELRPPGSGSILIPVKF